MNPSKGHKDQAEHLRELVEKSSNRKARLLGDVYSGDYASTAPQVLGTAAARVIAITSGKGGVGKTNFAVNLGISLSRAGNKVLLLDADLGMANIDIVLGVIPPFNLFNVIRGEKSLAETVISGPEGLQILAGGSGVYELAELSSWQLDRLIQGFQDLDNSLDYLLIDTGAGIGRQVLSFLASAQETIIVTTPEPTAVTDAYGLIKMLYLGGANPNIRVVVNMVESPDEAEQIFVRLNMACERFLGAKITFLGYILKDAAVSRAVKEQVPFLISRPTSKASRCIMDITSRITQETHHPDREGGLLGLIRKVINFAGA